MYVSYPIRIGGVHILPTLLQTTLASMSQSFETVIGVGVMTLTQNIIYRLGCNLTAYIIQFKLEYLFLYGWTRILIFVW